MAHKRAWEIDASPVQHEATRDDDLKLENDLDRLFDLP